MGPASATCFNIGVTYQSLRALGLPPQDLARFPMEFRAGITARPSKLGDTGESAPAQWPALFDAPARVHLVATVHTDDAENLDPAQRRLTLPSSSSACATGA